MSFEDRYALQMPLGETVRGSVWSAKDGREDKTVAVAILASDAPEEVRAHFQSIHLAAKLGGHAAMVRVLEIGQTADGRQYAVLEHVEGESLRARLAQGPPLALDQLVRAIIEVLEALEKLHDQDLAHGDVSPGNLIVRDKGGRLSKRLVGLGMGRARIRAGREPLDDEEQLVELAFMAPAQARGEVIADARSDTWSAAAVLYAALTGFPPHYGESLEALREDVRAEPVWGVARMRPDAAGAVADVVDRALGSEGFATASELAAALRAALVRSPRLAKLETPVGPLPLLRGEEPPEAEAPSSKLKRAPRAAPPAASLPKPAPAKPPPGSLAAIPRPGAIPKPAAASPPRAAKEPVAEPPRAPGVPEAPAAAFEAPTRPNADKPAEASEEAAFEAPTRPSLVAQWPRADAPVGEIERLSDPFSDDAAPAPAAAPAPPPLAPPPSTTTATAPAPPPLAPPRAAAAAPAPPPLAPPPSTAMAPPVPIEDAIEEELGDEAFEEWRPPSLPPSAFEPPPEGELKRPSFPPDEVIPPRAAALASPDEPIALPAAGLPKWMWAVAAGVGVLLVAGIGIAIVASDGDPPPAPTATLPETGPTADPGPDEMLPPDPVPLAPTPDAGIAEVEVAMDEPGDERAEPQVLEAPVAEPTADGVTRLRLAGVPAGATVFVDGRRAGGPDIELPAGTESALIEVRLSGHRTWRRRLLLAVPDELAVHLEPERAGGEAPPPREVEPAPETGGRSTGRRRRTRPTIVTDPGF